MPVEVRFMERADIPRVAELWAEYLEQTQFAGTLRADAAVTRQNLVRWAVSRPKTALVGVYAGEITSFLFAHVDYWVFNNQPFVSNVVLYPGAEPTHAAGLSLVREMHKLMADAGIEQVVSPFYSGVKEEELVALLGSMGYNRAGVVLKRGC